MLQTTAQDSFSAKSSKPNYPPVKQAYSGEREYLRPHEVEELMKAARNEGRNRLRDATIILLMFRHGLRSAELVALKWSSVDLKDGYLAIHRVKHGHQGCSSASFSRIESFKTVNTQLSRYPVRFHFRA